MINPNERYPPQGYIYPSYYYQHYTYQQWLYHRKSHRYSDKLWPFRMTFLTHLFVQYIMLWEIAVLSMPTPDLRFRLYSTGMLTGIQFLPIGGFILMLITFFRSMEYWFFYKEKKYLVSIMGVVIAFFACAYAATFLVVS